MKSTTATRGGALQRRRAIHLIDIENLHGGSVLTAERAALLWDAYRLYGTRVRAGDRVVLGTGPTAARTSWFGLPLGIERVLGRGVDGAEKALISAVDIDHASSRYDRIVVASGDHRFVPLVEQARAAGMDVELVLGAGAPARSLMAVCPRRSWLRFDGALTLAGWRGGARSAG